MMTSKCHVSKMDNAFDGRILAEKLSKLNKSEQSIKTLSDWCIDHQNNAKQVVETWYKFFNSSQRKQRVPLLYLANDIMQNSRRRGRRFTNRFWKVLPGALKDVYENGDDNVKNAVTKLLDIWEERRVFGSRGKNLRDEVLDKDHPPLFENNRESSQSESIKTERKDAHSIRIKLAVGDMPEKIVTAFQSVYDDHLNEDAALIKCQEAFHCIGKMDRDVDDACTHGNQHGLILANELQEQESILSKCIEQLGRVGTNRANVVAKLKEALQEQESKLELVQTQLQVAQAQVQKAISIKQRLSSCPVFGPGTTTMISTTESATAAEPSPPPSQVIHTPKPPPPLAVASFTNSKPTTDEERKRTAAAIAAKLIASPAGAQILTSAMLYLVAEEAASKNGGLNTSSFATRIPDHTVEEKCKIESPIPIPNIGSEYFRPVQQQQQQQLSLLSFSPVQASGASMLSMSQTNQQQLPPFAPPPTLPAMLPPAHQYVQSIVSAGTGLGDVPYGYGGNSLPPPPPPTLSREYGVNSLPPPPPSPLSRENGVNSLPPPPPPPLSNFTMGWARPPMQQEQPQPQPQPKQQHSVVTGYISHQLLDSMGKAIVPLH